MKKQKFKPLFYAALRILHNSVFAGIVLVMCYFAGWMIVGASGMFLAMIINFFSGKNYEQEFLSSFSKAGKVVGILAGIWFCKSILKR